MAGAVPSPEPPTLHYGSSVLMPAMAERVLVARDRPPHRQDRQRTTSGGPSSGSGETLRGGSGGDKESVTALDTTSQKTSRNSRSVCDPIKASNALIGCELGRWLLLECFARMWSTSSRRTSRKHARSSSSFNGWRSRRRSSDMGADSGGSSASLNFRDSTSSMLATIVGAPWAHPEPAPHGRAPQRR
jgi:hypothetical protein